MRDRRADGFPGEPRGAKRREEGGGERRLEAGEVEDDAGGEAEVVLRAVEVDDAVEASKEIVELGDPEGDARAERDVKAAAD